MKPPRLSEIQIVGLFRSRARIHCPAVSIVGIPNAGKRTQWAAMQAMREGLAPGFPDILCFWVGKGVAAIEFKDAKGRLSPAQAEWIERLNRLGFPAEVHRGPDTALAFLRRVGAPFLDQARAA